MSGRGLPRGAVLAGILAFALVGGGVAWLLLDALPSADPPQPVGHEGADPPPPEPAAPPRTHPDPAPRRVSVPRPSPRDRSAGADQAEPAGSGPAPPPAEAPIDSDFPRITGGAELGEALTEALADVQPELIDCLSGWHRAQPETFEGRAVFALGLDADGVHTIDVLDVQTVPEATLTCLGDVMWDEVDWPAVEAPIEVTWPIQVSVDPDAP